MKLLLSLIVILTFLKGQAQFIGGYIQYINKPEDIRKAKITGLDIYRYSIVDNKILDSVLVQQNAYDSMGNIYYMMNSGTETRFTYAGNKLSKATIKNRQLKDSVVYVFKYDSLGNLSEEISYAPVSPNSTALKYEYADSKLKAIYEKMDNEDFQLSKQYSYKNDQLDTIKEWVGKDKYFTTYEYANNGRMISVYQLFRNRKIKSEDEIFDEKGNLVEILKYRNRPIPGESYEKDIYTYENNLRIESKAVISGQIASLTRYFYLTRE